MNAEARSEAFEVMEDKIVGKRWAELIDNHKAKRTEYLPVSYTHLTLPTTPYV